MMSAPSCLFQSVLGDLELVTVNAGFLIVVLYVVESERIISEFQHISESSRVNIADATELAWLNMKVH